MAIHTVRIKSPPLDLGNADIVLDVKQNAAKLGTLQISKASVQWLPRDKSKRGKRMGWQQFAIAMETVGTPARIRRRKAR